MKTKKTISGRISFLATVTGMLLSFTASAQFWQTINDPHATAQTLAMGVAANGNVLAGTLSDPQEYSSDHGITWHYATGATVEVHKFVVKASGDIYGCGGVFVKSTDNGQTYISTCATATNFTDFVINSTGDIFAITGSGRYIYHSANNGVTWDTVNATTFASPASNPTCIAINASNELFVGTNPFGTGGGHIFRSTDNGVTFTAISGTTFTGTAINHIHINSIGDMYAGTNAMGMYRSTDDGATWTAINTGLTGTSVNDLLLVGANTVITSTVNNGVFKSTNKGNTWTNISTGLQNLTTGSGYRTPTAFALDATGYVYAGTNDFGTYRSGSSVFTGIEEQQEQFAITVAPNPFTEQATISFDKELKNATLTVYDVLGKQIKTIVFTGTQCTLEKEELKKGMYFIRVTDENKNVVTRKISIE